MKRKILIVDDEPDSLSFTAGILESAGFDIVSACDGIDALALAGSEKPDMVLLDFMMPIMSGYELCEQIKTNFETKDIPVICVSSATNAQALTLQAGASAFVVKPFSAEELLAQVRRYLKPGSQD